jgi:hypothetical protein
MKLLITIFLIVLSVVALRAQTATTNPQQAATTAAGYLAVFPQAPLIAIRFDGNSEDIAKVLAASRVSTGYNHDGTLSKALFVPHLPNPITAMWWTTINATKTFSNTRKTLNQGSGLDLLTENSFAEKSLNSWLRFI